MGKIPKLTVNFTLSGNTWLVLFGMNQKLIFKEECYALVGICMKVHSKLGKGFKEVVYKDALELEFLKNGIPYVRERRYRVTYEETILQHGFDADFCVHEGIILEIKATSQVHSDAFRQTLNYLKVSHIKLGILINFGTDRLTFQRIVCSY